MRVMRDYNQWKFLLYCIPCCTFTGWGYKFRTDLCLASSLISRPWSCQDRSLRLLLVTRMLPRIHLSVNRRSHSPLSAPSEQVLWLNVFQSFLPRTGAPVYSKMDSQELQITVSRSGLDRTEGLDIGLLANNSVRNLYPRLVNVQRDIQ